MNKVKKNNNLVKLGGLALAVSLLAGGYTLLSPSSDVVSLDDDFVSLTGSTEVSLVSAKVDGQPGVGIRIKVNQLEQFIPYPPQSLVEQTLIREYLLKMPERLGFTFAEYLREGYTVGFPEGEILNWQMPEDDASEVLKDYVDNTLLSFPYKVKQNQGPQSHLRPWNRSAKEVTERDLLMQQVSAVIAPSVGLNFYYDQESELASYNIDIADITTRYSQCMTEKLSKHASDEQLKVLVDPGATSLNPLSFSSAMILYSGVTQECKVLTDHHIEGLKVKHVNTQAPKIQ